MVVMLLWILVLALALAVSIALYAARTARQQQERADALAREHRTHEEALEHFIVKTLPSVAESIKRPGTPVSAVDVPAGIAQSQFGRGLWQIAERYADDLRLMQSETRDATRRSAEDESRQAVVSSAKAARSEVEAASREATSAAVRSFGTSVVSLGADVSQVVSGALREHRDDDVYETLIRIDHSVQQMIRQAQSYVIVCGGLPGRRWPQQSLTDIIGGAIGRVRDYLRVRPGQLDRVVISRAVEPLVHTLATLLDNALRYSPPTSFVDISFQEGHHGVTVIIDDAGVRMNSEQMDDARQVLAGERSVDIHQLGPSPKVGFPGIAALARRYGFTVYIDGPNAFGGMRAMVYVPETLLVAPAEVRDLASRSDAAATPTADKTETTDENAREQLVDAQSTVHEITNGGLPKRRRRAATAVAASRPTNPRPDLELARPDIAGAWQSGSKSGRAAASDHTEGMTS